MATAKLSIATDLPRRVIMRGGVSRSRFQAGQFTAWSRRTTESQFPVMTVAHGRTWAANDGFHSYLIRDGLRGHIGLTRRELAPLRETHLMNVNNDGRSGDVVHISKVRKLGTAGLRQVTLARGR